MMLRRSFVAATLLTTFAADVWACSVVMSPHVDYRGRTQGFFLGRALSDTVLTGPPRSGNAQLRRFGMPDLPAAYGQLVRIDSAGGSIARGTRFAVVVAWGIDATCRPTPTTRSARWLEPGKAGLFDATLRDSSEWINGMPTFDAFRTWGVPYTGSFPGYTELSPAPEKLFELLQRASRARDDRAALRAVIAWVRENPGSDSLMMVRNIIDNARELATLAALKTLAQPLKGTYEVTATLTGSPARTFTFTSFDSVRISRGDSLRPEPALLSDEIPPILSYLMEMEITEYANPLKSREQRPADVPGMEFWAWIPTTATRDSAGIRIFEAEVAVGALALFLEEEDSDKTLRESPARFRIDRGGRVTFDYRRELKDGRIITLNGRRVSLQTYKQ